MHVCESCEFNCEPILSPDVTGGSLRELQDRGIVTQRKAWLLSPNISFETVEAACTFDPRRPQHHRPGIRGAGVNPWVVNDMYG